MAATAKSNANGRFSVERSDMAYVPQQRDSYVPSRSSRRGLLASITSALMHPVAFFREMPRGSHVIFIALIMLALTGYAAVNIQPASGNGLEVPGESGPIMPVGEFTDMPINPGAVVSPIGGSDLSGMPIDGGFPPDGMGGPLPETDAAPDITGTTITVVTAAAGVLLGWGTLATLLLIVPMLRGRAPMFTTGMQIAVWSSLPLALMILVQVVYQALGGTVGEHMGLSSLLSRWDGFLALPEASQVLLTSLMSQITLFSIWSLIMIYAGARGALRGSRFVSLAAVIAWALLAVIAPVVVQTLL